MYFNFKIEEKIKKRGLVEGGGLFTGGSKCVGWVGKEGKERRKPEFRSFTEIMGVKQNKAKLRGQTKNAQSCM